MEPISMRGARSVGWRLAGCLLLAVLAMGAGGAGAADRRILWQGREQFLAIEPHGLRGVANAHPAQFTTEQLRSVLGPLQVRPAPSESRTTLFTEDELTLLVEQLQRGLSQAGPMDDVTFAFIGLHPLAGFLKEPRVTTGRVFVADGKLHVIFGLVHEAVRENEDRRLKPFKPGERTTPSPPPQWRISSPAADSAHSPPGREDWLQFPLAGLGPAAGGTTPPPAPAPKAVAAPPMGIEERLTILEGLRKKNLISEEEYRDKRRRILDGL